MVINIKQHINKKEKKPSKYTAWKLLNKYAKYYKTRPYVYGDIVKYKGKFYIA